jgi:hypothetical protein
MVKSWIYNQVEGIHKTYCLICATCFSDPKGYFEALPYKKQLFLLSNPTKVFLGNGNSSTLLTFQ